MKRSDIIYNFKSRNIKSSSRIYGLDRKYRNNYRYKIKDAKNKPIVYGTKEIRKYLKGGHYHIIIDSYGNKYVSVGLTSDDSKNKRNQKLHKVYESNGTIARLKRNADIDDKKNYQKRVANFNVDTITERKARIIGLRKLKKEINSNK